MRKFLIPIINLVNVILVSIAFGISANTSAIDAGLADKPLGNYYQLIWNPADKANILGIVGFFLFVIAAGIMLFNFLPLRARKYTSLVTGLMFIAGGVLILKTPASCNMGKVELELTGSLIAMAVLVIIAGAFSLAMSVLDLSAKDKK